MAAFQRVKTAIKNKDPDTLRQVLTEFPEFPADYRDHKDRTLAYIAAKAGSDRCLDALIRRNAPIDVRTKGGSTALHTAIDNKHTKCATALIAAGANINAEDSAGSTPAMKAIQGNQNEILQALLARNVDPNARNGKGTSLSFLAVSNGSGDCLEELLKHDADPNVPNQDQRVALHCAAVFGDMKATELLLQYKANVNVANGEGATELEEAVRHKQRDVVDLLIVSKAQVTPQVLSAAQEDGFQAAIIKAILRHQTSESLNELLQQYPEQTLSEQSRKIIHAWRQVKAKSSEIKTQLTDTQVYVLLEQSNWDPEKAGEQLEARQKGLSTEEEKKSVSITEDLVSEGFTWDAVSSELKRSNGDAKEAKAELEEKEIREALLAEDLNVEQCDDCIRLLKNNGVMSMRDLLRLDNVDNLNLDGRGFYRDTLERVINARQGGSTLDDCNEVLWQQHDGQHIAVSYFENPEGDAVQEYDVFLSHRGPDTKTIFTAVVDYVLRREGVKVFFDYEMYLGRNNDFQIAKALHICKVGVAIISQRFHESKWCVKELNTFVQRYNQDDSFRLYPIYWDADLLNDPIYAPIKRIVGIQNRSMDLRTTIFQSANAILKELGRPQLAAQQLHDYVDDYIMAPGQLDRPAQLFDLGFQDRIKNRIMRH